MSDIASTSMMSRLLNWLDPARVSHLRTAHFWTVMEERDLRRGWIRRFFNSGYQRHLGEQFMFLAVLLWMNPACLCLAIPVAILLLLATPFSRAGARSIDGDRLPWRLLDVLHPTRPRRDVARDLWLAGLGGREAALAIYREHRRGNLTMAVVIYASQLVYAAIGLAVLPGATWSLIVAMAAYNLVISLVPVTYFYVSAGIGATHAVKAHVAAWRDGRVTSWRLYSPAIVSLAYLLIYVLLTFLTFGVMFQTGTGGMEWAVLTSGEEQTANQRHQIEAAGWWLALAVIPMLAHSYWLIRGQSTRLEKALTGADESFQDWIQRQHEGPDVG